MPDVQRTLVKSPPELWAEVSDPVALTRHLGELGDIRIIRLEAETTVAWEGDRVRGTVELEASGWGTRVTLTAEPVAPVVVEEEAPPAAAPARVTAPLPAPGRRAGLLSVFRRRPRSAPSAIPPNVSGPGTFTTAATPPNVSGPGPSAVLAQLSTGPGPSAGPAQDVEAVLAGVLDELGSASRRPFAR